LAISSLISFRSWDSFILSCVKKHKHKQTKVDMTRSHVPSLTWLQTFPFYIPTIRMTSSFSSSICRSISS
jgi:hypothetical protein